MAIESFVEPSAVFEQLERDRESGELTKSVLRNGGYGVSKKYPDYISRYDENGKVIAIGKYKDGVFVASKIFAE